MLRTNQDKVVQTAVQGGVNPPKAYGWEITADGRPVITPPGLGGITYNIKVGDSVYGWASDHAEPGVSCTSGTEKLDGNPNKGLNVFACVGNDALVVSGAAKGARGVVTGHHGGVEHVLLDFGDDVLDKLTLDDKFLVRAWGQGLKLLDYPDITVVNTDPRLLAKMGIEEQGGKLHVPVAAQVPAVLMGSGLGRNEIFKGDYDIQTADAELLKEHGLDKLRLGDFVAILDHDATHGWSVKRGAVTIAVVVHGDSFLAGHGPGVSTLLTSRTGRIAPVADPEANLGQLLGIGRFRS
jgi:hypothetical protein